MKKIIELCPSDAPAKKDAEKAIRRLEPLAAEKREKLKEEMIGERSNSISIVSFIVFHFVFVLTQEKENP